ncbi:class I SAM-dependent methyltransferase [Granulicoccus phenolivorans]|uniref:class I SAM-dependent methyltransferase n=1 Tax=Granulicoccus phenolivorans TaxID=266854 RepID=UPI00042986DC|nr:class I SAM-dependent methyltransferase [Granulicoccus phenolivorans]
MDLRHAAHLFGKHPSKLLHRLNARHPWSHNDAFHPWIMTHLPTRRRRALDVGCGRGELVARLAEQFEQVHGIDTDAGMRNASRQRCAGLDNVTVSATGLDAVSGGADLITMVAVLHHLDLAAALTQVRRILSPGGRFLCVGLARPDSFTDHAWEAASILTNPLIGVVRHPWVAHPAPGPAPFPVRDPQLTFAEIRARASDILPGVRMRHQLAFRFTLTWTKPDDA